MKIKIGIIDYGMGNLKSVEKACHYLGFDAEITAGDTKLANYDKIILPGVGAFSDAIQTLQKTGLADEIHGFIRSGRDFLGICLGMQLLFERSYENGEHEGLGILPGEIVRLDDRVKVPQIGWNSLSLRKAHPLLDGIGNEPYVYFVHSYHVMTDADIVSATTEYGGEIQVAVQRENIYAVQFHPEKSGDTGLRILKNFGGHTHANLSGH